MAAPKRAQYYQQIKKQDQKIKQMHHSKQIIANKDKVPSAHEPQPTKNRTETLIQNLNYSRMF